MMKYEDEAYPFTPRLSIGGLSLADLEWRQPKSQKDSQRKKHIRFQSKNEMWVAIDAGYGAVGDVPSSGWGYYGNWGITKEANGQYCIEACHEEHGFARAYYDTREDLEHALIHGDNHEGSDHWEQPIFAFGSSYWIHWQWGHK